MSQPPTSSPALTVVLVHGAFADSSSGSGVIECLKATGVPVVAVTNVIEAAIAEVG